jgi:hypothetical protein
MGGVWRDDHPDNIQATHWWCNEEKGSTRTDGKRPISRLPNSSEWPPLAPEIGRKIVSGSKRANQRRTAECRRRRLRRRQFSMTTAVISASTKVNVTMGPSCTFSTKGGRKQAIQTPSLCRTLGYTIPAEPLVNSLSPSVWESV